MAAAGAASGNELSASGATAAASEDIAVEAAAESKLVEVSLVCSEHSVCAARAATCNSPTCTSLSILRRPLRRVRLTFSRAVS